MPSPSDKQGLPDSLDQNLVAAREGSQEALGKLLELCRPYLLLVANKELQPELRAKINPSDLVQESFLKAHRYFDSFAGGTLEDLLAWLRQILLNNLANATRHYCDTEKRQVSREVPLQNGAAGELPTDLAAKGASPSSEMVVRERDVALRQALDQLPEMQRRVVEWRNYERLSFEEIGQRLDRSAEAARKLWGRAIDRLEQLLGPANDSR